MRKKWKGQLIKMNIKDQITHILFWHEYQYRDICFRKETERIYSVFWSCD